MATLNQQQIADLERRRNDLSRRLAGMNDALAELASAAGADEPDAAPSDLEGLLDVLEGFLSTLDTSVEGWDRSAFLRTRLVYFVGSLLILRYGGQWLVVDDPESEFFLMPVVGGFHEGADEDVLISPTAVIRSMLSQPMGRSLKSEIEHLGLGNNDTAPQLGLGGATSRHAALFPKLTCTCGQPLDENAGARKASWMAEADGETFRRRLREVLADYLRCQQSGTLDDFVRRVLRLPFAKGLDEESLSRELVAYAMRSLSKELLECPGCGRLWVEANGGFKPYAAEHDERGILSVRSE